MKHLLSLFGERLTRFTSGEKGPSGGERTTCPRGAAEGRLSRGGVTALGRSAEGARLAFRPSAGTPPGRYPRPAWRPQHVADFPVEVGGTSVSPPPRAL